MYSRILVALDGSKTASHALDAAIRLAHDVGAQLQALYVGDLPVIAYDVPGYDPSSPTRKCRRSTTRAYRLEWADD